MTSASAAGRGDAVSQFAASLRSVKERSGMSYRELAKRSLLSTATLRRYCTGEAVPPDFATVFRLVKVLDVDRDELVALHQKWLVVEGLPGGVRNETPAPAGHLPAPVWGFTGREDELIAIESALLAPTDAGVLAAVVIHGPARVGKSALAIQAAHRLASKFPHGQLYVDLLGTSSTGQGLPTMEVIEGLLTTLGIAAAATAELEEAAAGLRNTLAEMRLLVVLDDAADAAQILPLLPGTGQCAFMITSRRSLTGVAVAGRIPLCPLAAAESDPEPSGLAVSSTPILHLDTLGSQPDPGEPR